MSQTRHIATQVKDADRVSERRAHIVRAAARVFRAKGFHGATIRDVAIEAGLSQGSLYNYVRTKDDILYLVHRDLTEGYTREVEAAIATLHEPCDRFRAAIAAFTRAMRRRSGDIALIYQETHALGPESRRAVLAQTERFIELFSGLIAEARAAGMALPGAGKLAGDIVTFLPIMLALRRKRLKDIMPGEEAEVEVIQFLLRGLGVDDAV